MENKVAIITGSRRGLGKETAYMFASKGYDIVINDKEDQEKIKEVVNEIETKYKVRVLGICLDISKEENVKKLLEEILKKFKRIDILVNNAGIVEDMEIEKRDEKIFNKTIINNITSTYLMCKYIGKYMFEHNELSRIVNISSTNGINSFFPTSIDYDASKAGIISLTNNFALEYQPKILVNAVAPGWINTEMNKQLEEEVIKEETEKIYLKRFAEPKEVATLIYFLCSEENTYVNGETIKIDGGY